jgi:hypothetical protein
MKVRVVTTVTTVMLLWYFGLWSNIYECMCYYSLTVAIAKVMMLRDFGLYALHL